MEGSETYRDPQLAEKQLLARLLEARFSGRDEIATQIESCKVRKLDEHGCLQFLCTSGVQAPIEPREG